MTDLHVIWFRLSWHFNLNFSKTVIYTSSFDCQLIRLHNSDFKHISYPSWTLFSLKYIPVCSAFLLRVLSMCARDTVNCLIPSYLFDQRAFIKQIEVVDSANKWNSSPVRRKQNCLTHVITEDSHYPVRGKI